MTNMRNYRIRFSENNFAELISASINYSSQSSTFPFSNCLNKFRSRVWKPTGAFIIESTNKYLYINDGTDKTVTLTEAVYTTPELFATHVQTQLNAVSANWTVTYDRSGETYKFTIENTSNVTLQLTQTTDAAWDILGYTTNIDITDTSFEANEQRNHSEERVTFDLGYNATITFFALIGPLDEIFSISNSATVTLMGSNLNQWTAPPFTITISVTDYGAMRFLDDQTDTAYRYWRVVINDRLNPNGPDGISIGHLYLGDYVTITNRNVNIGFNKQDIDPTDILESESGVLHFDTKTKYGIFDSMTIGHLQRSDKDKLRLMYEKLGKYTPFYISLDPTNCTTDVIEEMTKYVVFNNDPKFQHIIYDIYSMNLSVREIV